MTQSFFDLVTTTQGVLSILDRRVGEIMHNPLGPWREIQELYIKPSQLKNRLQAMPKGDELVLFDVGLGAGSNSMGAILTACDAMKGMQGTAGIQILSFEQDLSLAQFALKHKANFLQFSWAWEALEELLGKGHWEHSDYSITWDLIHGDFTETINKSFPSADLIFYDPYSPQQNMEMWTFNIFSKLRKKCHFSSHRETLLLTYSRATSVRAALLLAGFYVGTGRPIGLKEETTIASTLKGSLEDPLGKRWLERWRRSHTRFPPDLAEKGQEPMQKWMQQLENQPQFK